MSGKWKAHKIEDISPELRELYEGWTHDTCRAVCLVTDRSTGELVWHQGFTSMVLAKRFARAMNNR